ncbi:MAG: hypothetical protein ABIK11_00815 [candidate division WOR-3 bacterium]
MVIVKYTGNFRKKLEIFIAVLLSGNDNEYKLDRFSVFRVPLDSLAYPDKDSQWCRECFRYNGMRDGNPLAQTGGTGLFSDNKVTHNLVGHRIQGGDPADSDFKDGFR